MASLNLEHVSDRSADGIAHEVHRMIDSGNIPAGTRLPPVRDLARQLMVSPATVGQAWKRLADNGIIETRGRSGTYVADLDSREPWRQFRGVAGVDLAHDLSTGFPDPTLLPDIGTFLHEAAELAYPGYRAEISRDLLQVVADDVVISSSPGNILLSTHVLGLMNEVLPVLGGYRTEVVVGDPEFAPYLDLLERARMIPVPVALDDEGLRLDLVEAAVRAGSSAIILQPRVHNPTGVVMSEDRLRAIAELCRDNDVAILESDYFGALGSAPTTTAARWAPDQTLYIRSYSKDVHPDVRVVVASGSPHIIQRVLRRRVGGYEVSSVNQQLLRLMLISNDVRTTTARAKSEYDRRRGQVVEDLGRQGVEVASRDGLNLWVPVRSEEAALLHLAYNGISAAPGSAFQVVPTQPHLRVSVAGMSSDVSAFSAALGAAAAARRSKT